VRGITLFKDTTPGVGRKIDFIATNKCNRQSYAIMGLFHSSLSEKQKETLRHSQGFKLDDIQPLFGKTKIPIYKFHDYITFQNHTERNSIAFFLICGNYIASVKSTIGGKICYYL
jgi:hypothetical protein